jgi:hypothetical protein
MDEAERKERQRLYERAREEQQTTSRLAAQAYDKALLTLSSAFLGGSLAFTGQVVDLASASSKALLYWAWIFFVVTIVLTLASFVYSLFRQEPLTRAAERYYRENDQDAWKVSERVHKVVLGFSVAYGLTFLTAVLLLVGFISTNLAKGEPKMLKKTINAEWEEKSIPPGTFQPVAPVAPAPETPTQAPSAPAPQKQQGS